jgi:beta-glucanase (GH16 family)
VEKPYADFHVYAVEWTPEKMDFYFDDRKYFTVINDEPGVAAWPFDSPHYLILNAAVGGSWGGKEGVDPTIFPQQYLIDYVRVFQKK